MINKFAIITSSEDPASVTMNDFLITEENFTTSNYSNSKYDNLIDNTLINFQKNKEKFQISNCEKYPNIKLFCTKERLIYLDDLDWISRDNDFLIFLSKHMSKSLSPTLTSHFTGNFFEDNSFGGSPCELGIALPTFQKKYMKNLSSSLKNNSHYDIVIEASHHGPTSSGKPILFIEIGSSEDEWNNKQTAAMVCKILLMTINQIQSNPNNELKIAIGLGGNHYPRKFNNLLLGSDVAFGSIASKYNLSYINEKMLNQMISKSVEKIEYIYIDEKGLGKEKNRILSLVRSQDLEIVVI